MPFQKIDLSKFNLGKKYMNMIYSTPTSLYANASTESSHTYFDDLNV